jgi:hypothetical protein
MERLQNKKYFRYSSLSLRREKPDVYWDRGKNKKADPLISGSAFIL